MSKAPIYQRATKHLSYAAKGFLAIATLLGTVIGAFTIVTPFWTVVGSIVIIVLWVLVELVLRVFAPLYMTQSGVSVKVRSLGAGSRFWVLGVLVLLWLPRFVASPWFPRAEQFPLYPQIQQFLSTLEDKERIDETVAVDTIFGLIDKQIQFLNDCPDSLRTTEWSDFKKRLSRLDFHSFSSPKREDLDSYRIKFIKVLDKPPTPDSSNAKFDCGFTDGELLLALRPVLVDFELNAQTAMRDGKSPSVQKGLREYTGMMKEQFIVSLGGKPDRLSVVDGDARTFFEYLLIWLVLYLEPERPTTVIRAQGALLAIEESGLQDLVNSNDFKSIHRDLVNMSRSKSKGDELEAGRSGSRILLILSKLSDTAISTTEARFLGGDKIVKIVDLLRDYKNGQITDTSEIVEMLRTFAPERR